MYIKTTKPSDNMENPYEAILNYIENLKEEISLSLGNLNKKINHIQSVINEMRGESE